MMSLTSPVLAAAAYDEMLSVNKSCRPAWQSYHAWLKQQSAAQLQWQQQRASQLFRERGVVFQTEKQQADSTIPFDTIPRIIPAHEWHVLEAGVLQRARALNCFLHDIYHSREIVRAGIISEEKILLNSHFLAAMIDCDLPQHTYAHISGIDVIRQPNGRYAVLEDNVRVPSGMAYMLETRRALSVLTPSLLEHSRIAPLTDYLPTLKANLQALSFVDNPSIALLTPGPFNSAYFEHQLLAKEMGIHLAQGHEFFVDDLTVYLRNPLGKPIAIDVIYRRVDDQFLDPLALRPDSLLGIPGLIAAMRAGRVQLANAPGTGVADDKSIYPYVPQMIEFYLGQTPLLENIETWQLSDPNSLRYVLAHLSELAVKEVHGAGGYGMLIGPAASREELSEFKQRILANPANYIAQPTIALSTCPVITQEGISARHIDLRPFVLCGANDSVSQGGLTRVALSPNSLVVNSSQGGGVKDTWVLHSDTVTVH